MLGLLILASLKRDSLENNVADSARLIGYDTDTQVVLGADSGKIKPQLSGFDFAQID